MKSKEYVALISTLNAMLILSVVVNILLESWFRWCSFDYGLFRGFLTDDHDFNDKYSDLQNDICGNSSAELYYESFCDDFCNSLDKINTASIVLFAFFVCGLLCNILNIVITCLH